MRQQDRQINDDTPDVIKSEPVPVPGPGNVESPPPDDPDYRHRAGYPGTGVADHGPEDALDERGSYGNDLATSGPGPQSDEPATDARAREERRGDDRLPEERAEDEALDDDALDDRTPADRTADPDGDDDRGSSDRGDLADASQADSGTDPRGDADDPAADGSDRTDTRDRPDFHEPAPLPTSFGAPTVGGAVAAAAMAGSHRDAREEDTVRSGDGPAEDRIDGVGDEPKRDYHATRGGDEDRSLGAADATASERTGGPAVDRDSGDRDPVDRSSIDGIGSVDPVAVGTSHPVNPDVLSAGNPDAIAGAGRGPDAGGTTDTGSTTEPGSVTGIGSATDASTDDDTGSTPDGEMLPGAAPAEPIVAILDPDTVQGFRDRWREVSCVSSTTRPAPPPTPTNWSRSPSRRSPPP